MNANRKSLNDKNTCPQLRRSVLATASVLALGGFLGSAANAQTISYLYTPPATQPVTALNFPGYTHNVPNQQFGLGTINATLLNNLIWGNLVGGTPTLITNTNNSISALAKGNVYTGSLITALGALGLNDSLGVLSGQVQTATVNSSVTNGDIRITETLTDPGINILTGNKVLANTALNQSDQAATGKLPAGYANARVGSVVGGTGGGTIFNTVTGSTALVNHQNTFNAGGRAGSKAFVTGADIALDLSLTTSAPIDTSQEVNNNAITANYQGNGSSTKFIAEKDSARVEGSVVVSNNQANIEVAGAAAASVLTAEVAASAVSVNYRDRNGAVTDLSGPLVTTGNSIAAVSTGNSATSRDSNGNVVAGNVISLAEGVNMLGVNSARNNILAINAGSVSGTMQADLVLSNGQGNSSTALNSTVNAGAVTVTGDNVLATGSITLDRNSVASAVTGSVAGNLIQTQASNLTGSVATGNLQSNDETTMIATTTGANISVNVGSVIGAPNVSGKISASTNAISASSRGNVVDTNVFLDASNLTLTSTGSGALADSTLLGYAATTSGVGATATNLQGIGGATAAPITALVDASNVRATFVDQVGLATRVSLSGAAVAVDSNAITSAAAGNTAGTALALGTVGGGTANASGSAAVANTQDTDKAITGTITNSGVAISALNAAATAGPPLVPTNLTASANTMAASARANVADNSLSSTVTNLAVLPTAFSASGSAAINTGGESSSSNAALAIASAQNNKGDVVSSNISNAPFVVIDLSGTTAASTASVNQNAVSSSTRGNDVANALSIDVTNLATAAQVGSISNLQQNNVAGVARATVEKTGGGLAQGILFGGNVSAATSFTVSGNSSSASVLGNTADNALNMSAKNYAGTSAPLSGTNVSTPGSTSIVSNEFALVNRQVDAVSNGRTATNQGVVVGVYGTGAFGAGGTVNASNLTVAANTTSAEAFNNNARNSMNLVGALNTNLTTGAGALNDQSSSTAVGATVGASENLIRVAGATVVDSNLVLIDNTVKGLSVGNSAANALDVTAVNLTGNTGAAKTTSIDSGTGLLTANTDFGLGNVQRQTGNVTAAVTTSMRVNFDAAAMRGGTATLTGNEAQSIAQSNSASSDATLDATNVTATGAVASYQNATGVVLATQGNLGADNATYGLIGLSTSGTPLVVSDNSVLASGGQNEAFNTLAVNGTTLAGRGINNPSAYVVGGLVTAGADYSVLNVQTGVGSVTATALPGLIGTRIPSITGSSVSINGNDVTAKATVNNASNRLLLNGDANAGSTLNATGVVSNVQTNTAFNVPVTATVNNAIVGVATSVVPGPMALNSTVVTVSGNSLNAIAGGNNSVNAMEALAAGSIGPAGLQTTQPTFAVLNSQSNAAAMQATASGNTVGVNFSPAGSVMTGSSATVMGNQVLASGYGNMASNSLTMSVLIGNANASTTSVSNSQSNTAAIASSVSGTTIGAFGGTTAGTSSAVISGNSITAQSVGNSAFSTLASK